MIVSQKYKLVYNVFNNSSLLSPKMSPIASLVHLSCITCPHISSITLWPQIYVCVLQSTYISDDGYHFNYITRGITAYTKPPTTSVTMTRVRQVLPVCFPRLLAFQLYPCCFVILFYFKYSKGKNALKL